ncbi:glutamate--tRNA ligase [Candidatus Kaiserbacteria bacterium]|nr:glutamate--tRNA ligase [Candidatus Kaiserbacteria bacterium]
MDKKIITRYAPSPTGFQHIGGIRTALFAYLAAKQSGGTFILRIEDTDKSREVEGAIEHTMEALRWLGLNWDIGPDNPGDFGSCLQSDRLDIYKKYAHKLIAKGLAYPDPYSQEELEIFRQQAKDNNEPFLYRKHRPESFVDWDEKTPLRLRVENIKRYKWHDEVRGDLEAGEEALDDYIIIKSDGYPTYNFAHIIDDYEMGVTHIMRGDEFISSMPKFLSLYDALEISYPKFISLPPIMNETGNKKLGKRDGAQDILEYKKQGYLPETMVNFLAMIGWNPGTDKEIFSRQELLETFSIAKIQKSGGAFNVEKLKWMNKEHLLQLNHKDQFTYVLSAVPDSVKALPQYNNDRVEKISSIILERYHNLIEINESFTTGEYDWVFTTPHYETELLKWKQDTNVENSLTRLDEVHKLLTDADFSSTESIKSAIWDLAEKEGRGQVLWPLRVALSGREKSPDPFNCAYILDKQETLLRIKAACDKITGNAVT